MRHGTHLLARLSLTLFFLLGFLMMIVVVAAMAVVVGVAGLSETAFAKTEISLPVPASELELSGHLPKPQTQTEPAAVEVAVSSFSPTGFSRPTYSSGTQEFQTGSIPFLSFNRVATLFSGERLRDLRSKVGLAMMRLTRAVNVPRGVGVFNSTQDLDLFSLRLGVEYEGPFVFSDRLRPFAGMSLLPTVALASHSQLEGSVNVRGLPIEASVGFTADPSFLQEGFWGLQKGSVGLGAHVILGSVGESKMNGVGVQGFVRVVL